MKFFKFHPDAQVTQLNHKSHKPAAGDSYYCWIFKNCDMLPTRNAPVEMPGSEFRRTGYQLIDQIADFIDNISRKPISNRLRTNFQRLLVLIPLMAINSK